MLSAGTLATAIIANTLIQAPESLSVSFNQFACAIEAIHFEARGESLEGKQAVMNTILNRVESDKFPDTICGVVHQRKQFSYRNSYTSVYGKSNWPKENTNAKLTLPKVEIKNKIEEVSFTETVGVAFAGVQGKLEDNTNGSLFYVNYDRLKRLPKWLQSMTVVAKVGSHSFLKEDV